MCILTYVQVCKIIKLKVYSELTLLKAFVDKLNISGFDGPEYDDSEGSTSEGSDYGHDTSSSGDISDSRDLGSKSSASGPYFVPITDISCQHHT